MTEQDLLLQIAAIPGRDRAAMDRAQARQDALAKPPGSLGKLEEYAIRMAGITGDISPRADHCCVLVFAADNGVVEEGVSCAPQSVTQQQCINMTRFKTGMSSMAHHFGDDVLVTDVGVAAELPPSIANRKIRYGTSNIAYTPAMTRQQAIDAIAVGMETALQAKKDGAQVLGIGEMGIGNTTTSACVLAALTGLSAADVTGRGGGLTDDAFSHKRSIVEQALSVHQPNQHDVIDILHKVGGLDISAMCGAYLGCAMARVPAVVDGYISIVAALCAARMCPAVRDMLFLSHASYEKGYAVAAQELAQQPCLLLNMRLGEGSGCVLMFRILQASCAVMRNMATFSEAAINDDYLSDIRKTDAFTVKS